MQNINDYSPAEARARLAAIIESSDDAIVSKSLDGIIRTWNSGAERIFGWKAHEVIDKPITIIIPADRLDEEPHILSRIRAGERVDHFETIRQTKDGRLIDVSVTISPVRDERGKIIGVSKVARDITLQKRFQSELLAARDAAETAKREAERAKEESEAANRAKDYFLSVLSHELRTPLTPVLGAISMIELDKTLPLHILELMRMIRRNVETEARLVDDLLDLTRIARGKIRLHFEVVDAHAMLRNALATFQTELEEKRLTLAVALRARRFNIWADPARFQQILLNLLSNAVKFTPENGTITVRTSNENGSIKIEISDTGIGINEPDMPRLFKPFEQGEQGMTRKYAGLGLGLSIVKSLVELHKASVSATSEGKDKGSTFILRVETVSPEAGRVSSAPSSDIEQFTACRVLLVEDHQDTRKVLAAILESMGCAVVSVGSVKEAMASAEASEFDLLLSDIGLPDGSGMELMRQLGSRFNIKGIALSGFGQDEDLRRSSEAGFATHLTKPVNMKVLQEVIKKLVK